MQNRKGWILLPDPFSDGRRFGSLASQMQREFGNTQTLIFDEDGRFLEQMRMTDGMEDGLAEQRFPRGDSGILEGGRITDGPEGRRADGDSGILHEIRAALQDMRGCCRQVGIAAEGFACGAAAAVAAQLPVDEILLFNSRIFTPGERKTRGQRQFARIAGFARRNLSLVVADAILLDCAPAELRRLLRFLVNGSVRIVHSGPEGMANLWRKDESYASGHRSIFKTQDVRPK